VALANAWCIQNAENLPAIHGVHQPWRYTLISGILPALPLICIRPFLPESPVWQAKKSAGQLQRPSIGQLFADGLRGMTIKTTLLFACCYGVAFGAIQHLPQIVPGMADVKQKVAAAQKAAATEPTNGKIPAEKLQKMIKGKVEEAEAASVQKWQEIGGLVGRCVLALLVLRIASRRRLLQLFILPSLLVIPGLFWWLGQNFGTVGALGTAKWWVFFAGLFLVGQFSFWGNYIPKAFPPHLRGTGESFAANIGGRLLGVSFAWLFFSLSDASPPNPSKMALTAAYIAGGLLVVSLLLSFRVEEPKHEE
jgi:hypothetical protein